MMSIEQKQQWSECNHYQSHRPNFCRWYGRQQRRQTLCRNSKVVVFDVVVAMWCMVAFVALSVGEKPTIISCIFTRRHTSTCKPQRGGTQRSLLIADPNVVFQAAYAPATAKVTTAPAIVLQNNKRSWSIAVVAKAWKVLRGGHESLGQQQQQQQQQDDPITRFQNDGLSQSQNEQNTLPPPNLLAEGENPSAVDADVFGNSAFVPTNDDKEQTLPSQSNDHVIDRPVADEDQGHSQHVSIERNEGYEIDHLVECDQQSAPLSVDSLLSYNDEHPIQNVAPWNHEHHEATTTEPVPGSTTTTSTNTASHPKNHHHHLGGPRIPFQSISPYGSGSTRPILSDTTGSIAPQVVGRQLDKSKQHPPPPPQRDQSVSDTLHQRWFAIPEPVRFGISGNVGNLCLFLLELMVFRILKTGLYPNMDFSAPWLLRNMSALSFFIAYLLHIVVLHALHATLVYGWDSIKTWKRYCQTLAGMYGALVFSAAGSTALNSALLHWSGLSKNVAFCSTLLIFACINYFVLGWIVHGTKNNKKIASVASIPVDSMMTEPLTTTTTTAAGKEAAEPQEN